MGYLLTFAWAGVLLAWLLLLLFTMGGAGCKFAGKNLQICNGSKLLAICVVVGALFAVRARASEPGFTISSVSVTNVPCCDGRLFWYQPDDGFGGYNVRCCRQVTLTWPTVAGKSYRVLMTAPDSVSNRFGVWNIISVKLPGTGGLIGFTTGAPNVTAFYKVEEL